MTHTPGPWELDQDTTNSYALHATDGAFITICFDHAVTHQDAANAELIAAAPDLLRACELALAHVPRTDDAPNGGIHGLMQSAIAKAKGE